ncbi:TetR/AcrR family transcriptional regulator [Pectobacterium aquaticum]|uniref:TetR/AcrR family transcriptional regulator n=1 Tax=Pectobacterium aquaticum TaxID=2204145 RepID=UPI001F0E4784|nr:TetR/AcrR family transcriptional regulator [Pectobacterium aquaticum]MCH5050791.1 TetR/AcrR family transcriptional regulator [Pectobacterium aquaticum]
MRSLTKKEATRQRILDTASKIIRRDGFDALAIADVMKQAGLTHGGFYAHFPNRDALVAEALTYAQRSGEETITFAIMQQLEQGTHGIAAYIDAYLSEPHLEAYRLGAGCPIAALGTEFLRQNDGAQKEANKAIDAFIEKLISLSNQTLSRADAFFLTSALVGVLQLARNLGNREDTTAYLTRSKQRLLSMFTA